MPSVRDNERVWNDEYSWSHGGAEWSAPWRGPMTQWYGCILPRIAAFVPAKTILEIGPGFGRWTHYLAGLCQHLVLVDLSKRCIEHCRRRFASHMGISYHVNDGKSLRMIEDGSIDFAFSFDSLVHAEVDVTDAYLRELSAKLTDNGVAFLHHSNLGAYRRYFDLQRRVRTLRSLARRGLIDWHHSRGRTVTAERFHEQANRAGLRCIGQELITWVQTRRLIDAISVVTRPGSVHDRPTQVWRNRGFMHEAKYLSRLSVLYGHPTRALASLG